MAAQLVYEVHFGADFHRGSGQSQPGYADAVLDRDRHGLPRLLGSSIKGLARDGARRALSCLSEDFPDDHPHMRSVFGRPSTTKKDHAKGLTREAEARSSTEGRFTFLPATLPGARHLADLRHVMTERRFHNKVDDRLGRVARDFFFSREVGRRDLIFVGRVTWDHQPSDDEVGLLALGLRMIDALGGKRRRGEGTCLVELVGTYDAHWEPARRDGTWPTPLLDGPGLLDAVEHFIDRFQPLAESAP